MPPSAPSYLKAICDFPVKQDMLIDPELEKLLYQLDGQIGRASCRERV